MIWISCGDPHLIECRRHLQVQLISAAAVLVWPNGTGFSLTCLFSFVSNRCYCSDMWYATQPCLTRTNWTLISRVGDTYPTPFPFPIPVQTSLTKVLQLLKVHFGFTCWHVHLFTWRTCLICLCLFRWTRNYVSQMVFLFWNPSNMLCYSLIFHLVLITLNCTLWNQYKNTFLQILPQQLGASENPNPFLLDNQDLLLLKAAFREDFRISGAKEDSINGVYELFCFNGQ